MIIYLFYHYFWIEQQMLSYFGMCWQIKHLCFHLSMKSGYGLTLLSSKWGNSSLTTNPTAYSTFLAWKLHHLYNILKIFVNSYNCSLLFSWDKGRKDGNVLFNNALNTFYLRLHGVRHMVKNHSDRERENLLPPHRLLFSISSKDSFICIIPQTIIIFTFQSISLHRYIYI